MKSTFQSWVTDGREWFLVVVTDLSQASVVRTKGFDSEYDFRDWLEGAGEPDIEGAVREARRNRIG